MENTAHHSWFTEHRGWEDFCSALFGGLIILSPVIDGTNTVITANAGIRDIDILPHCTRHSPPRKTGHPTIPSISGKGGESITMA